MRLQRPNPEDWEGLNLSYGLPLMPSARDLPSRPAQATTYEWGDPSVPWATMAQGARLHMLMIN